MRLEPDYPIATARLTLRPLRPGDADELLAYRSRPDVCRWVPFQPMTRAEVEERLAGRWSQSTIASGEDGDSLIVGVELRATGRLIGDLTLSVMSAEHRGGEIGWVLHPEHGGRGYATEAARALLGLGFSELGLHRVLARVDARNAASLALCERLGMRREAHLVANEWFKGGWSDEIDYALLQDEWRERSAPPAG